MNRYDTRRIGYLERALAEWILAEVYGLSSALALGQRTGDDGAVELVVRVDSENDLPYEDALHMADKLAQEVWMPVVVIGGRDNARAEAGRRKLRAVSPDPRTAR